MHLSLLLLSFLPSLAWAAPQVTLGSTTINGLAELSEDFFGGIPYAQPPTGANRFKPPVVLSTLPGASFDATKYGAACIQAPVSNVPFIIAVDLTVIRSLGLGCPRTA
jgi:acetylcholinesterase